MMTAETSGCTVNGVYSLIDVIVLPKLLQDCSWFITFLYCLTKSVTQIVVLKVAISPWSMLRDVVLDGRCTTLTLAWKSPMNRAWSTVEQQKNVEWDILLQAIFIYLQDKVVEKPVLENGLCYTGFGVTLPYNRKRVLGYVFKGSWFLWMINQERLQLHIAGTIATKQELAYPFLLYSMASTFPTYWCNFGLDTLLVQSYLSSVQFSSVQSVAQSCVTLCNPMNRSTPGLPVHHQLPESTQTHVHWVIDVIQPSHPLSSPSPPALNPFQHQGLFKWVSSSHQVAKELEFQLQHQSFQWTPRTDLL